MLWEQNVGGSNPLAPTIAMKRRTELRKIEFVHGS